MTRSEFEKKLMRLVGSWKCHVQMEGGCSCLSGIEREIEDLICGHLRAVFKDEQAVFSFMEKLCFSLLVAGLPQKQIAALLGVSNYAVGSYARQVRKKLKAHNQAHASYLALMHGLLDLRTEKDAHPA